MPAKKTTQSAKATKSAPKETKSEPVIKLRFGFWQQVWLTGLIAGFLLVVANSAVFVNQHIFNTTSFTSTAVTSVTSESSRDALASEIVDRALADRPVIKNVAGGTATKLISGLMNTSQFNRVLTTAVSKLQVYLTSNEQKSITLDLTGVKNAVNTLISVADTAGASTNNAGERVANLPDQLTLLNANNIPSFYTYGLIFLWLGPICAIGALALLAYPYFRDRRNYYKVAGLQGVLIMLAGGLSLLIGPLFRPPALSNIASPNMRIVVGNLYDAFIQFFNQQAYFLILAGLALAVIPWAVHQGLAYYNKKRK